MFTLRITDEADMLPQTHPAVTKAQASEYNVSNRRVIFVFCSLLNATEWRLKRSRGETIYFFFNEPFHLFDVDGRGF